MSTTKNPIQDILKTAIQREIDAFTLYDTTASKVDSQVAKGLLTDLAAQERGHRAKLEGLLHGRVFKVLSKEQKKKVVDYKVTDYLTEEPLAEDSDLQDILIVAGKREKASHDLYSAMAEVVDDEETIKLFAWLAAEELIHKRRVETLYEEIILKEN
ncbi:MAG: ferritin family protein [Chloroflexi bacterium]|nr:ferritin family protein [Chloroflexota bacterium]